MRWAGRVIFQPIFFGFVLWPDMSPELLCSAELITRVMPPGADWWIIGSTALALGGIAVTPRDIDVFAASDVIEAARLALGVPAMPSGSDLFRSSPYFQFTPEGGLEIDFMGDLEVRANAEWIRLRIESKVKLTVCNNELFIPSLEAQARILRVFGRPKDLARADLIAAHLAAG